MLINILEGDHRVLVGCGGVEFSTMLGYIVLVVVLFGKKVEVLVRKVGLGARVVIALGKHMKQILYFDYERFYYNEFNIIRLKDIDLTYECYLIVTFAF